MYGKVISAALASYGMSGFVFHAPFLHLHKGYQLKKVLERTQMRSAEKYPYVEIARTYDEIISDPEIDLVIVNTPDHLHFSMAEAALHAGKHVVVEKPFTQTVNEGKRLIELAKRKRLILSVYHNRRFDGDSLTVQQILREGRLGRLIEYEAHYDRYRNYISKSWKENPATGASIVYNLGSHLIDYALFLFGDPHSVWADIRKQRDGALTDDFFEIKLFYDPLTVTLKASYLVKEPGPRYLLHGTLGSFVKSGSDPQEEALIAGAVPGGEGWGIEITDNWGILHTDHNGVSSRTRFKTLPGNYMKFYDYLYESIISGQKPPVTAEDGLNVIRVIETAYRSHYEKRVVKFPL